MPDRNIEHSSAARFRRSKSIPGKHSYFHRYRLRDQRQHLESPHDTTAGAMPQTRKRALMGLRHRNSQSGRTAAFQTSGDRDMLAQRRYAGTPGSDLYTARAAVEMPVDPRPATPSSSRLTIHEKCTCSVYCRFNTDCDVSATVSMADRNSGSARCGVLRVLDSLL